MAYCIIEMSSGELYHHGILGMKWGVRKDRRTSSKKSSFRKIGRAYNRHKQMKKARWNAAVKENSKHLVRTNIAGSVRIYSDVQTAKFVARFGRTLYEDARLSPRVRTGAKYLSTAAWASSWYDAVKTGKMMIDANQLAAKSKK